MALKDYLINEAIEVTYQAAGAASGISVTGNVYNQAHALVTVPVSFTELGATGRYYGSFTPNAAGDWEIQIADAGGGKALKHFSVGDYNLQTVGGIVTPMNTNVVATLTAVQALDTQIDAMDIQLDTVQANLSAVNVKIDALESPPMIG